MMMDLNVGEGSSAGLRPVRRRTLSQEVVERLLRFIASGDAPVRRLPPEPVLCEQLEVSRTALREGLSALSQLGVIQTRGKARIGSTVAARSQLLSRDGVALVREGVEHPLEVRALLEPPMAALAAGRMTAQALSDIERFLALMREAGEEHELIVEYDSGFHVAIARATGNPTLVYMVSAIADALAATRELSLAAPGGVETALSGHQTIVDALRAHDSAAAQAAMHAHIQDVAQLLRQNRSDRPCPREQASSPS